MVHNFKCSSFSSFLHLHVHSTGSLFLASLFPSIYGAAFVRMFPSRRLCAIIRRSFLAPMLVLEIVLLQMCHRPAYKKFASDLQKLKIRPTKLFVRPIQEEYILST